MKPKSEKTIKSTSIYNGKVISLFVKDVECANGVKSKREIITHPGGVCILAVINDEIIFESQFRSPYEDFILELPAGKLEKNENPIDAARRELEEETGYRCEELIPCGVMYPSVGYTNEKIHLFIAKNLSESKQNLDDDEQIDVLKIKIDEVKKMLLENKIKDAKTVILLQKYFLEFNK